MYRHPLPVLVLLLALLLPACAWAQDQEPPIPAWRDQTPGAAYLGPDVLWRPRETMVFHLYDDVGTGFRLTFTLRDMNTYLQGARPVFLWVTGPDGSTLARQWVEDDGVTSGNERYRDGIYDPGQDYRYREWHRVHSPGGYPPQKERSPYLTNPEKLPARVVTLPVKAGGKGLYRVTVIASWDHWVSVTPSRRLVAGVHPGQGPLYVPVGRLREAYFYTPSNTQDLGFATTEEIQPFNWKVTVRDETGATVAQTNPKAFYNFALLRGAKPSSVYRLSLDGTTTGCCLSLVGAPELICPDAATARLLHAGAETDAKGRVTYHPSSRALLAWADSLRRQDLTPKAVADPATLPAAVKDIPALLATQNLDPHDPKYGEFSPEDVWNPKAQKLAAAVNLDDPKNPYYRDPALVRRALLSFVSRLTLLNSYWVYGADEGPKTFPDTPPHLWTVGFRNAWFGFGIPLYARTFAMLGDNLKLGLPPELIKSVLQNLNDPAYALALVHAGECSNQWWLCLASVATVYTATKDPFLLEILDRGTGRATSPGGLGRVKPDGGPSAESSEWGYGRAQDYGALACGALGDGSGFDAEYCNEQVLYSRDVWELTRDPRILEWWDRYIKLKAHLAMFAYAGGPLVCPTDMSHRTAHVSAGAGVPSAAALPLVPNAAYFQGDQRRPLPCDGPEPFVEVLDNFYFTKTPGYYAVNYGGWPNDSWENFLTAEVQDGSVSFEGYNGMHYNAQGRKPTKLAGISALYVPGCGPVILSSNVDVFYSNQVWGRRSTPVTRLWEKDWVDPTLVCSGYSQQTASFDRRGRVFKTSSEMEYAPLAVDRTVTYRDDRVAVSLTVTATADLDLVELYECLPYYATRRTVKLYDQNLAQGTPLPVTGDRVSFRAVDISGDTGAGAVILFPQSYEFQRSPQKDLVGWGPGQISAFNLPLPARMRAGESHTIRYTILAHAQELTVNQLQRAATDR